MGDNCAGAGVTQLANMLAHLDYHDGVARLYRAVSHGAEPDMAAALAPSIVTVRDAMSPDAFDAAYGAGARLDPTAAGELGHQLIAQASADHHNKNT